MQNHVFFFAFFKVIKKIFDILILFGPEFGPGASFLCCYSSLIVPHSVIKAIKKDRNIWFVSRQIQLLAWIVFAPHTTISYQITGSRHIHAHFLPAFPSVILLLSTTTEDIVFR